MECKEKAERSVSWERIRRAFNVCGKRPECERIWLGNVYSSLLLLHQPITCCTERIGKKNLPNPSVSGDCDTNDNNGDTTYSDLVGHHQRQSTWTTHNTHDETADDNTHNRTAPDSTTHMDTPNTQSMRHLLANQAKRFGVFRLLAHGRTAGTVAELLLLLPMLVVVVSTLLLLLRIMMMMVSMGQR